MIRLVKSSFYEERKTKRELTAFIQRADIFSMHEQCKKFEIAFARRQKRKFAVFVASGSSANLILIQALLNMQLLRKGDAVGFSALTWATNVMPLIQLGLRPMAIDCEFATLNVSLRIMKRCEPHPKAVFLTNVLGFSDNIEAIRKWCIARNIMLLEDNCEALGSKTSGRLLGNFGFASTFSFFIGHHLSTIEGGMVCTDDEKLYHMLMMVRAHGWDRNLPSFAQKKIRLIHGVGDFFSQYTFYYLGYNVRPTEISGRIGVSQMRYVTEIVQRRERNFKAFHRACLMNGDFMPLDLKHMDVISNFAMPVVAKDEKTFTKYRTRFEKNDVEVRPIIAGDITQHPFYRNHVVHEKLCRNALHIHRYGFYFPNNPELTKKEVAFICALLAE